MTSGGAFDSQHAKWNPGPAWPVQHTHRHHHHLFLTDSADSTNPPSTPSCEATVPGISGAYRECFAYSKCLVRDSSAAAVPAGYKTPRYIVLGKIGHRCRNLKTFITIKHGGAEPHRLSVRL